MEIRAHKFTQQTQEMYVTVLSGKTVAMISDVDSVEKYPAGYQRELIKSRCEQIRKWVEEAKGLVPGGILLNVRPDKVNKLEFAKEGEYDGVEFGLLRLPEEKLAWQIDGQHREGAFEILKDDILVPVVFLAGLDRSQEAQTFFVVNSKQKNVSASLRYYDLMRYGTEEMKRWSESAKKESRELAYNIVVGLSEDSLWKGRINLTGVRGMKRAINLKGFMDGLDPVVNDRWFATLPFDRQMELMKATWRAMDKIWPSALTPGSTSLLTRTFGVHVVCGIAIDVFHYCDQLNDLSEDMMVTLVEPIEEIVAGWDPEGPLSAYAGGGRKAVTLTIDVLRAKIRYKFDEILEGKT